MRRARWSLIGRFRPDDDGRASVDPAAAVDLTSCGVVDALVFRRLTPTSWAHLGGLGRGKGWAGVVDVAEPDDTVLAELPAPGQVRRFEHARSARALGPYYAVGGAFVRLSGDVFVLFGNPAAPLAPAATDDALLALAGQLDAGVGSDITPSKKLADELEVLHAVRAVATLVGDDLRQTMQRVTSVAVSALSCEIGLIEDRDGHILAWTAPPGLGPAGPDHEPAGTDPLDQPVAPELRRMLDVLAQRAATSGCCVQDVSEDAELSGLRRWGVRSVLAVSIPPPVGGVLAVAHTDTGPRGFTRLCQQLGRHVAETAGVVAHTASLRDQLRMTAQEHARLARLDVLTGLGNRLTWEEALDEADVTVAAGRSVTVVTLDLDGLKHINDTLGHEAGDQLLRDCAALLRDWRRPGDVCVRLGGDEFGVLVPTAGPEVQARVAALAARLGAATSSSECVAASVGAAEAGAGASVTEAVRQADIAMYQEKRARRS